MTNDVNTPDLEQIEESGHDAIRPATSELSLARLEENIEDEIYLSKEAISRSKILLEFARHCYQVSQTEPCKERAEQYRQKSEKYKEEIEKNLQESDQCEVVIDKLTNLIADRRQH